MKTWIWKPEGMFPVEYGPWMDRLEVEAELGRLRQELTERDGMEVELAHYKRAIEWCVTNAIWSSGYNVPNGMAYNAVSMRRIEIPADLRDIISPLVTQVIEPGPTGRYGIDQGQFLASCGGGNAAFGERNSGGTPE